MKKIITTIAVASSMALTGLAGIASAQTTGTGSIVPMGASATTSTGTTGTGTGVTTGTGSDTSGTSSVGVPNTGLGGDAPVNYAILATSAVIALAAGAYALRSRRTL